MPIPTTFLDTCRTRILATAEYAAFVAAGALAEPITGAVYGYWGGSIAATGYAQLNFLVIPSSLVNTLA